MISIFKNGWVKIGVSIVLTLLFVFVVLVCNKEWTFEWINEYKKIQYDKANNNYPIRTHSQLDSCLKSLPMISYAGLSRKFISETRMDEKPWVDFYRSSSYYLLNDKYLYSYIVGKVRIIDLLAKDEFLIQLVLGYGPTKQVYLLLDASILHKLLDLQTELKIKNCDPDAIMINYSFRYPSLNRKVGGASKSQHLYGKALDLHILDIDKNGICDDNDKLIVLNILENKVIERRGGIGRYPNTQVVHMDVRGYRARWDYQNKKK